MTHLRLLSLVAAGFLCAASLHAQTSAIAPRIVQSVDDSNLVTLKGNVTALAQAQFDRGEADPSMQMTSVRLVLSRSQEQEAALGQFMAQQLDKSSPNYHHWLTPQEFGKLYGPADSDIAAIVAWLESHGLQVQPVAPGRTTIAFSGSVSQIEAAFHTQIHSFNADGREFYSNTSDPKIPAALSSVVTGVAGMNTIRPRSYSVPAPPGRYDTESRQFVPFISDQRLTRPDLTASNGALYIVAADAATIYDTPNSFNANFSTGTSYTGSGVTIGIGGVALIQTATVQDYRTKFIGDNTAPTVSNVTPAASYIATAGALGEAYLDTEVSGALAPGATIHYYVSQILDNAISQAINDNTVDIFSLSFGQCELYLTTADNNTINGWWQQAAAQGIAVTVSSGDSGSAGCDNHETALAAAGGFQVSGFASTPYNIAVGGTDMYGLLNGFSTYVSSTNGNLYRSAKSYIPESTWNSSVQSDGVLSANVPFVNSSSKTNIDSGSGGPSTCSSNTTSYVGSTLNAGTCTSGYAKPSWQRGTGVPSDGHRDIPDVSLMAGAGSDDAAWLICTDDTFQQNGTTYTTNCTAQSGGGFAFSGSGGTSASAPAFAGILALVQQKMGGGGAAYRLGADGAKTLYDLFNGAHASAIFHDVTQGNNSVPCTSGSPNCAQNTAGNYFITGYDTGAGYDLATGLGSVDATQLINYWGVGTGTAAATLSVTPSATNIGSNQSLTVNVTVAGSGSLGTPTGTVALSFPGYASPPVSLSAGGGAIIIPSGKLLNGPYTLTITYSGDNNYATSTQTATVTVWNATVAVSGYPSAITVVQPLTLNVAVSVSGGGLPAPTGSVSAVTSTGSSLGTGSLSSGAATISIPGGKLPKGPAIIDVNYSGDANYTAASGDANVQVNGVSPNLVVNPSWPSIVSNQPVNIVATVMGANSGPTPTGTIRLSVSGRNGSYASGAITYAGGPYTFTIPPNTFTGGTAYGIFSYSGDSVYAAASDNVDVTVTQYVPLTPTVTIALGSTSIDSGQPLNISVTVAGTGATPGGTATVTGGGYTGTATALSSGAANVTIPANSLASGTDTLTASYSGDLNYAAGTATTQVNVTQSAYTVTTGTAPSAINPGGSATETLTIGTSTSYSGTISLACVQTAGPSNQVGDAPNCTVNPTPITLGGSSGNSVTATVSISTTAASAQMQKPRIGGWMAGGGTALALLVFFGIPARRRRWRTLLGMIALLIAFGGFSACGGGGGSGGNGGGSGGGGGGGNSNPGTAAGSYTFTVTGTGTPSISPAPTATISLTIN